jgi:hypothetical protein
LLHCTICAIKVAKGRGRKPQYQQDWKKMSGVWKTKFGLRRVRRDTPTLDEAIFAAKGLSDNPQEQAEIAASLLELPLEEVMIEVAKRKNIKTVMATTRGGAERSVIVERRTVRRPVNNQHFGS